MSDSHHDDFWRHDEAPLSVTVTHAVEATEAIRAAAYRMQVPERLDVHSLVAVGAALEDITRELAKFAGALPGSVDQNLAASQEIRDGLVAFRIAVLDASVAARSLGWSATSVGNDAVPRQRRR